LFLAKLFSVYLYKKITKKMTSISLPALPTNIKILLIPLQLRKQKKSSNDESMCSFQVTVFMAVMPCSSADEPAVSGRRFS
jgi:hypothetical protein